MNIAKIDKYKKWTAILWRSTKQIWTLLNTENWTWRKTKQTWPLLKLTNAEKKLNNNSMMENKTEILNTNTDHDRTQNRYEHYYKTEQHFYRGIQNWHEHDWKTEQHFYDRTLNRTQLHFDESNNKHTRMFVSCFDKVEGFYDRYKVLLTISTLVYHF